MQARAAPSIVSWTLSLFVLNSSAEVQAPPWLSMLQELLSGPLTSSPVMAYFDQNLSVNAVTEVSQILVAHPKGVIFSKIRNGEVETWLQSQPDQNVRGEYFVHIFFMDEKFAAFREMGLKWNPDYLILFCIGKSRAEDLLKQEAIAGVRGAILIESFPKCNLKAYFPFKNKIFYLGEWNAEVFRTFEDVFPDRFPSFEGYTFHLGTWLDDTPYIYQSRAGPKGEAEGISIDMLDAIKKVLNFSYTVTEETPDMQWGAYENGSWSGMLGMVYRKEKNFTVNFFVITNQRRAAFDATVSYWNEGFGMSMLRPSPQPKWKNFYYPFTGRVWLGFLFTLTLAVLYYELLNRATRDGPDTNSSEWTNVLRSLFNNSWPHLPRKPAQQVFVGFWLLFCMVATYAYTANLVAFLTVPIYPKPIQTVEQLAHSDYRLAMYDYGEFVPGALSSSQDATYRAIGAKLELYPTYAEAVYPMLNGTHAHLESFTYNRIVVVTRFKAKDSYMLREQLYPGNLCWYFQKNTAYVFKFNVALRRLVEAGLVEHWLKVQTESFLGRDWERRERLQALQHKKTPLCLQHLQGVFLVLLLCDVAAFCVLLAERARLNFWDTRCSKTR